MKTRHAVSMFFLAFSVMTLFLSMLVGVTAALADPPGTLPDHAATVVCTNPGKAKDKNPNANCGDVPESTMVPATATPMPATATPTLIDPPVAPTPTPITEDEFTFDPIPPDWLPEPTEPASPAEPAPQAEPTEPAEPALSPTPEVVEFGCDMSIELQLLAQSVRDGYVVLMEPVYGNDVAVFILDPTTSEVIATGFLGGMEPALLAKEN